MHVFGVEMKRARGGKHEQLENVFLSWFKRAGASNINFDGSILQKALEIESVSKLTVSLPQMARSAVPKIATASLTERLTVKRKA